MKLMKLCSVLLFLIFFSTTYADENKYIFIGQNGHGESAKTAFVLEITAEDCNNVIAMNENGEVYLKADNIVAISKETFANFAQASLAVRSEQVSVVTCKKCNKEYDKDNQSKNCPHGWLVYRP